MIGVRTVGRVSCLALLLGGCGDFPEVEAAARARVTTRPVPPQITPVDAILEQAATLTITDADTAAVAERAMTLQSRAAGLQAPVADPAMAERLISAIPVP
jgi:hypothetical protein